MNNYEKIYSHQFFNNRLKPVATFVNKHKFWGSAAAIFYAILCLLFYTSSEGLPFPVSFLGSPALLIATMIVAFFFPVTAFIILFLPIMLTTTFSTFHNYDLFDKIYKRKDKIFAISNIRRFLGSVGISILFVSFIIYIQIFDWSKRIPGILLFLSTMAVIIFSGWLSRRYTQRFKKDIFFKTILYIFVLIFWYLISCFILLKLLERLNDWPEWTFHALYFATTFTLQLLCYTLTFPPAQNFPQWISAAAFSFLPLILFVCMIPINTFFIGLSLKVFQIGGGYTETYYVDIKNKKYFPDEIFEVTTNKNQARIKSKKVMVVLSTKDRNFIKITDKSNDRIFEVDPSKILYKEHHKPKGHLKPKQ